MISPLFYLETTGQCPQTKRPDSDGATSKSPEAYPFVRVASRPIYDYAKPKKRVILVSSCMSCVRDAALDNGKKLL